MVILFIISTSSNQKKRTCQLVDFAILADHREKIKEKQEDRQILGSCQRAEKAVEHKNDDDSNWSWCPWNGPQTPGKETEGTGDQGKNWVNPDHSTTKISKNSLESPRNLKIIAVTQTSVKTGEKNLHRVIIIIIIIITTIRIIWKQVVLFYIGLLDKQGLLDI